MTNNPLGSLDALDGITLSELQHEAAFLTRKDRKYLLPLDAAETLLSCIDPAARVLEIDGLRHFHYRTPYFDDARHTAYLGAARRRPNRFKVRVRLYEESGDCLLEAKVRDARGRTVKHRTVHEPDRLHDLTQADREWLATLPQIGAVANDVEHCLTTRYLRTTLVLPRGEGRVTIDQDLVFTSRTGETGSLPGLLIVETKGAGGPTSVDRLFWRAGIRPVSISKFASGLSLLSPDLPANRWHRLRGQLASETVYSRPAATGPTSSRASAGAKSEIDASVMGSSTNWTWSIPIAASLRSSAASVSGSPGIGAI